MRKRKPLHVLVVVLMLTILPAVKVYANDVYIVQGSARGPALISGELIYWSTDALFFNRGAADARVKLLGVSNGGGSGAPPQFTLPPQRSASLERIAPVWKPGSVPPLWLVHLDLPADVSVESLLFIGTIFDFGGGTPPIIRPNRFGKVRVPVFTALVPANQPQVHLGTYFGEMPSRINVAVYNASTTIASTRIEIRQQCDDTVVATRVVSVPPDAVVQFTGFPAEERQCPEFIPGTIGGPPGAVYTVVTVDQPSFTFVSNLSNSESPLTSMAIAGTP